MRERVHYGSLDVEDLGRVYEALLELEPGFTSEPMCRLRRQKLEVVVPVAQGEKYRPALPVAIDPADLVLDTDEEEDETEDEVEDEAPTRGKKTKVKWIEDIPPGRFYLRVGIGRKATGSYYTPHSFVRFLVQETVGPQVDERSPKDNPNPGAILQLKVLDPAMGSAHFLVEACRFLGDKLYEACRLCDERATTAEKRAETAKIDAEREAAVNEAREFRQRVIDLPDPDDKLVKYLPSSAPEGQESGFSQKEAEALCRRLVAVHCLYGVDKNPLAVELAKLSLWIESHAEGLPLTFLDHRLVVGDSLTGPFFEHLLKYPGSQEPIDGLFVQGIRQQFTQAMEEALKHVRDLEATVGVNISEIEAKQAAKARFDRALVPFRIVAAAWAGGVMLRSEQCDDVAYSKLLQTVGSTGDLPEDLLGELLLLGMIARGLGVEEVPSERAELLELLVSSECIPALPYDLTFAEVFYPNGTLANRQGFDVILGNPPWDRVRPIVKEFYAAFDISILDAPTKRELASIERRLLQNPEIQAALEVYIKGFTGQGRVHDTKFTHQSVPVDNIWAGRGNADAYCLFAEVSAFLLKFGGRVGLVLPSGFHANEGATGIRQLYLEQMFLKCCYSFENRKKLFEIDSRFKFATVVAQRGGVTNKFYCAFYLHDDRWLFDESSKHKVLHYSLNFVKRTGGEYLSLVELRSYKDLDVAKACFAKGDTFGNVCNHFGIRLSRELDMARDSFRFTPTSKILLNGEDPREPDITKRLIKLGYLMLHEGKTFHQYTDRWAERPRYVVSIEKLANKSTWLNNACYFRTAYRTIAASTNERTGIFNLHPPGIITGDKSPTEQTPALRPNIKALYIVGSANTFVFDFALRLYVSSSTVNYFYLARSPLPLNCYHPFVAHSTLRLTCNHFGYEPLWREQLGDAWRELNKEPFTFPVLATDDERWVVRATIDAVVADAYGLTRDQYAHVLSTFSHKSYSRAPQLCLACFDELKAIGLEAFTQKYDPYWDIPLNESLPKPVIDLPIPTEAVSEQQPEITGFADAFQPTTKKRTSKKREGK